MRNGGYAASTQADLILRCCLNGVPMITCCTARAVVPELESPTLSNSHILDLVVPATTLMLPLARTPKYKGVH